MNKLTFNFLSLLVLATVSLGMVWPRLSALATGQASFTSLMVVLLSAPLFIITFGLLVRIILYSAKQKQSIIAVSVEENHHA